MKMLQFVFVVVLAFLPISNLSMELNRFPHSSLHEARLGNFQELCKWFCGDQNYHDYFFRVLDDAVQPRIFCGLCKKKISTTTTSKTTTTTTTTTPTTSTPTTGPFTISTPTTGPPTTSTPTTVPPTTSAPTTGPPTTSTPTTGPTTMSTPTTMASSTV